MVQFPLYNRSSYGTGTSRQRQSVEQSSDFIANYNGDSMIPCIISAERSSIFRQAKENTPRAGLSAMARQVALLLLTIHGYEIPTQAVSNDFYRHALELDLLGKRECSEAVLSAMGGIKKAHFSAIKALLRLSDEASVLADRDDVTCKETNKC